MTQPGPLGIPLVFVMSAGQSAGLGLNQAVCGSRGIQRNPGPMKRKTALEHLGQLQSSHRCSFYSGHRVDDFANLLMAVVNCVVPLQEAISWA